MDQAFSDEESEISESEVDDYVDESYLLLKNTLDTPARICNADGTFRCPFCAGKKKQDYRYKDLLQHATGIGASSSRKGKQRVNHLAFAKYLQNDVSVDESLEPPSKRLATGPRSRPEHVPNDDLFVWPWMGVIANAGLDACELSEKMAAFAPSDIRCLPDGYAVIEFRRGWSGFKDAMAFENHFDASDSGRKKWMEEREDKSKMFGWVARAGDHRAESVVGDHLRECGMLKTISELLIEDARNNGMVVANLADEIDAKNELLHQMESQYRENTLSIMRVVEEQEKLNQMYNEEKQKMEWLARENARRIFRENDILRMELDRKRTEIELRSKEFQKLEAQNEIREKKLEDKKLKNELENNSLEMASQEQKKVDENVLRLVEEHKREKENALQKILQLERELDEKQQLELETEQLKGKLQVMKYMHLQGEDEAAVNKKLEDEIGALETKQGNLLSKGRKSNDELQLLRKDLIKCLEELKEEDLLNDDQAVIGIKRLGELDSNVFLIACKKKYAEEDDESIEIKAAEFCTKWQKNVNMTEWYPFKMIDMDGKNQEIVNENDEKLLKLKKTLGNQVLMDVKRALLEMNEYNGSGRYPVPALWNFKEGRKATLKEVLQYISKQLES